MEILSYQSSQNRNLIGICMCIFVCLSMKTATYPLAFQGIFSMRPIRIFITTLRGESGTKFLYGDTLHTERDREAS